ncbi:TPA: hypothetical protein ACHW7I_000961 [Legionella pneumophila]|uniref:Uncharacterized protein n=5 Tax=Legionella TaxID=445 RepID=A0A0W0XR04_9GAMM|nr:MULTISPECIES: hypothetical protein [Legionellaceae]AMV15582.1 hypothetical protein ULM_29220 [Legionella pneumophila]ETO94083.1 hypothetical protein LOR_52c10840 [Legionella oakridgensis RV-2-2007]KTC81245.1 hypothetical protein Lbru_1765 [Legionella brunensis]KTD07313.1 hypothetical protein Ljam_1508 [Legionella jamestowniensis]KTD46886.1 hypothetical protein Lrub_1808 [Legionella rubrilucens]
MSDMEILEYFPEARAEEEKEKALCFHPKNSNHAQNNLVYLLDWEEEFDVIRSIN